jgi:hypothetical protein
VLTEKLDEIDARLEHTPRKLLKSLAQEPGMSKSRASKLGPCKTTIVHSLQPAQSCELVAKIKILPVKINIIGLRFDQVK